MKVATFNICGWKSAINKGLIKFIKEQDIDIIALQELRTLKVTKPIDLVNYFTFFNPATFQGTAIISKRKPLKIRKAIGCRRFDEEGRFIQFEFENFIFINVYMPHGRRDKSDLPYKLEAYKHLRDYLFSLFSEGKPIVLAGDFNIARKEIDLAKPKENRENIMFTQQERREMEKLISLGFVDTYRLFHEKDGYTWWPRFSDARKKNIGWRIDYIFVSETLKDKVKDSRVFMLEISDHCPVITEIEI